MSSSKHRPDRPGQRRQLQRRRSMVSFGAAALLAVAATAQVTSIDHSGSYRQEVQSCQGGQTPQDRATCLREARNAQADKQRGALDNAGSLQSNATARCDVFRGEEDRRACLARVREGTATGSVEGGGILRQYQYTVPGTAAPATTLGSGAPEQGGTVGSSPASSPSTMGASSAGAPLSTPSTDNGDTNRLASPGGAGALPPAVNGGPGTGNPGAGGSTDGGTAPVVPSGPLSPIVPAAPR